ncbi:hypothetical protein ACIP10_37145, partial [Streptomyces galbus]
MLELLGEAVAEYGMLSMARQAVGVLQVLWQREAPGQSAGEPLRPGVFDELTARILGVDVGSIWETDRLRLVKLVVEAAAENRADSTDQLTAYALRPTVSTASSRLLPRPPRTTAPTNAAQTASATAGNSASAGAGTRDGAGAGGHAVPENGDGDVAGVGDVAFVGARPAAGDVRGGDVWRGGARFWLSRSTLKRVGRLDLSHVHVQSYVYTDEVRSEVLSPAVVAPWAAAGLPAPFVAAFHLLPGQDAQLVVPRRTPVTVPVRLLVELLAMDPLLADAPDNTPIVLLNPAGPATRVARALARRLPGRRVWSATGYSDLTTTNTINTDTGASAGVGAATYTDTNAGTDPGTSAGAGPGVGGGVLRIVLMDRTDVPESMRPPLGQWTLEHRPPVIIIPETPRPGTPSPSLAEHPPPHTDTPMDADTHGEGDADMRMLFPGLSSIRFSPGMDDDFLPDDDLGGFLNSLGDLPDPDDDALWDALENSEHQTSHGAGTTTGPATSDMPPNPGTMTARHPSRHDTNTNIGTSFGSGQGFITEDWMNLDDFGADDDVSDSPDITDQQITATGGSLPGPNAGHMPPNGLSTTGPHNSTHNVISGAGIVEDGPAEDRMDMDPGLTDEDSLCINVAVTDDQAPIPASTAGAGADGGMAGLGIGDVPPDRQATTGPQPGHSDTSTGTDFATSFLDSLSFTDLTDLNFDLAGAQRAWAGIAVTDDRITTSTSAAAAGTDGEMPGLVTGDVPPGTGIMTSPHPEHPDSSTDLNAGLLDGLSFTDLMDLGSDFAGSQGAWAGFAVTGDHSDAGHLPPDPGFTTGLHSGTVGHAGDSPRPHQPPVHPDDHTLTTSTAGMGREGRQAPPIYTTITPTTGLFDGEPVTLGRPGQGPTGLIDSLLQALRTTTPNTTIDPDTL